MKKFFAMAMAGVMTLSMSAVALAASSDAQQAFEVTGTVQAPTLNVVVPTSGSIVINPYELEYEDDGGETHDDQIICPEDYIYNAGDVAVTAKMTVKGTKSGNATFATAPFTGDGAKASAKNDIYLYAEVSDVVDHAGLVTNAAEQIKGTDTFTFATGFDKTKAVLVADGKDAILANAFTLNKVTGETDSEKTQVVAFRLAGQANGKAATAWTAADTASVLVTFDFLPTVVATE